MSLDLHATRCASDLFGTTKRGIQPSPFHLTFKLLRGDATLKKSCLNVPAKVGHSDIFTLWSEVEPSGLTLGTNASRAETLSHVNGHLRSIDNTDFTSHQLQMLPVVHQGGLEELQTRFARESLILFDSHH